MELPTPADALGRLLQLALAEDIGTGDVTALATIAADAQGHAEIRAKQSLVIAGIETLAPLWSMVDPAILIDIRCANGARLVPGQVAAVLTGPTRSLLTGERTCLNLLCRLSGIATLTADYVAAAGGRARIFDTRKTTPGFRFLEKAAVKAGGGANHRFGLYDQILIKDNHSDACGGVGQAIARARNAAPDMLIEVEVRDAVELRAALDNAADIILLDNMDLPQIREAVVIAAGRTQLEVSGNVTLPRIAELAATGVDRISCGALTHSAPVADLHMKLTTA
jgi:nicotinate-nucleotide pyrophosphorylase (carboxylating)